MRSDMRRGVELHHCQRAFDESSRDSLQGVPEKPDTPIDTAMPMQAGRLARCASGRSRALQLGTTSGYASEGQQGDMAARGGKRRCA